MPAATVMQNQINCLETGLKSLKMSQLKERPEFIDMYGAIEKHHKDVKLAYITGKAKDLLQQAEQDTKFYYILVNMLKEIQGDNQQEQKGHLSKVYAWYQKNQHVLHTKPKGAALNRLPWKHPWGRSNHFGKKKDKDPRSILKNSLGQKRKDSESIRLSIASTAKSKSRANMNNHSKKESQKPDLDIPIFPVDNKSDGDSAQSSTQKSGKQQTQAPTPKRAQNRKDSDISHLLPKRKALPLSAVYNPHGRDLDSMSDITALEHNSPVKIRVGPTEGNGKQGSMEQKIYQMRKWDAFQQEQGYGQELLSKMQHVGRTGAPGGVRYTAHENGLMAEDYTHDVISTYTIIQDAKQQLLPSSVKDKQEPKRLANQTLEQFYEQADNYYPPNLPKYPSFDKTRIQSAPSGTRPQPLPSAEKKRAMSAKITSSMGDLDADSEDNLQSSIKLDAIVGMIDTVTDEMNHFKEKLVPDPQAGFRQPVADIDPSVRPQTALVGAIARPASPEEIFRSSKSRPGSGIVPGVGIDPGHVTCRPGLDIEGPSYGKSASYRPGSALGAESLTESGYGPGSTGTNHNVENSVYCRREPPIVQQVVEAIDWRGKVVPDVARNKFGQGAFGGHTYTQKMPRSKSSLRTVGKTHAGSRPKTAPMNPREKWATENANDENTRAMSQAASHIDTEVDQEATDNLLQIQHLGGKNKRRRRRQMLMNFDWTDEEYQRFGPTPTSVNMEFVSFITPKSMLGSRATSAARSIRIDSGLTGTYSPAAFSVSDQRMYDHQVSDYLTESDYLTHPDSPTHQEVDSMTGDLDLPDINDLDNDLEDVGDEGMEWFDDQKDHKASHDEGTEPPDSSLLPFLRDNHNFIGTSENRKLLDEINALVGAGPSPAGGAENQSRLGTGPGDTAGQSQVLRERSVTINPKPSTAPELGPVRPLSDYDTGQLDLVMRTGVRPTSMSAIAGRENQNKTNEGPVSTDQALPVSPRHRVYQRTFPKPELQPESRPSLAIEGKSTNTRNQTRSAGRAPLRARSASRQEMIIRQNEMLKKSAAPNRTAPSIPCAFQPFGSRKTGGGKTYMPELEAQARKDRSPRHMMEKVNVLRAEEVDLTEQENTVENRVGGPLSTSLKVQKLKPSGPYRDMHSPMPPGMPVTPAPSEEAPTSLFDGNSERDFTDAEGDGSLVKRKHKPIEVGTGSNKKTIHVGRPIPRYGKVEDPDEYAAAVALQRETQAAVDIQRIFRGYVVRSQYKYLQREEREKRENEQMAAIEIQRRFRGHLSRKKAISNRTPDQQSIQWAKEYKSNLIERQQERDQKVQIRTYQNLKNKQSADSMIAVIGPHVEVYEPFHPKKTGIDKSILVAAATAIQRRVRGWLVRLKFERLRRKSKQHNKSWGQFIGQYKELMFRIQTRIGIEKPKFYFSFSHVDAFMDTKKRYESVFDKKSFSNELDVQELPEYFKECDLYPAQAEIEEAMDALFRGQPIKKGRGLYKPEVLEITCSIYPPKGSGIVNSRKSTWMHPIIDGEEALKLIGTENVESADFKTCWKLVSESKKAKNKLKRIEEEKAREDTWQKLHGKNKDEESDLPKAKPESSANIYSSNVVNNEGEDPSQEETAEPGNKYGQHTQNKNTNCNE